MSSTSQAFVKAFARRSQSSVNPLTSTSSAIPPAPPTQPVNVDGNSLEARFDTASNTLHTHVEPDSTAQIDAVASLQQKLEVSPSAQPVIYQDLVGSLQSTAPNGSAVAAPIADNNQEPVTIRETTADQSSTASSQVSEESPEPSLSGSLASSAHTVSGTSVDSPSKAPLRSAWEVEVFDVSSVVADLFFEEDLFQTLSEQMGAASRQGLQSMLITSALPGEGRSTVAIGVALAAAASGQRVALVDGDLTEPTLADDLNLELGFSWVEHLRSGLPLSEVSVHAVEDQLTFFPLKSSQATLGECEQLVDKLKETFDLVIVDGPVANTQGIRLCASVMDSAIIVRDAKQSGSSTYQLANLLRQSGIEGVGIVENYT